MYMDICINICIRVFFSDTLYLVCNRLFIEFVNITEFCLCLLKMLLLDNIMLLVVFLCSFPIYDLNYQFVNQIKTNSNNNSISSNSSSWEY